MVWPLGEESTNGGLAAICATMIYSAVLQWRYFWLTVCVASFVALFVCVTQEATGAPVRERLEILKKKDLAAEAEKSVTGTRWLPELLRK